MMNTVSKKTLIASLVIFGGLTSLSTFASRFNFNLNEYGRGMGQNFSGNLFTGNSGPRGVGRGMFGLNGSGAFLNNQNFQAIQTALTNKNYSVRKTLMNGKGIAEKIDTEAKFLKLVAFETAMRNGDKATAEKLTTELDIGRQKMNGTGELKGGPRGKGRGMMNFFKSNSGSTMKANGTGKWTK